MKHLTIFASCVAALALHSSAWAEIYATKDAQGNTAFTDSPPAENAEVIELQQTNVVDAPQAQPQDAAQPEPDADAASEEPAPVVENNTVMVHDGDDNEGDVYDGYENDVDNAEMPHEVGDSESQMPHEVGDFPAETTGAHRR